MKTSQAPCDKKASRLTAGGQKVLHRRKQADRVIRWGAALAAMVLLTIITAGVTLA